ncbi:tyrosine-type recombinase/integrase [Phaeobacter gallaeciensis]|uniref:tyrosine-type recombinase/integrase n=1 Tax=Phaeobacter gallaeciensis TaxID=60890 RepID=UPI002380368E|nr:tyrosine-type recombinase/integrase [Phaeobacter gallaeciensis]MDE4272735.1 tyrosine-type recombinase/integrase [Phaeobacter gallaeciensis]MDE4298312.1 tyrosine-type recombinase/integrase [Phaeobacter gallaeciensis]MDE5183500.1 tyrosine-type recombinase/integrase [Phaeobacter gallaeciensis]
MAKNIYKPKSSKKYHLRVSIGGKEYRESLHTTSQRVAEKKARARIEELKSKADRGETDWLFHAGFTSFHDNMDAAATKHGWSPSTCKRYRTSLLQIGRTLADIFAERSEDIEEVGAWEIGVAEVTEFVALRKDADVSVATINRDLTAFNHLMSHIKNKGWIEVNPVQLFEKQGMREKLPPIVLPTETAIARLSARAPGTLTFLPGFLNETGGRITEMAMIKWSDLCGMEQPVEGHVTLTLVNTKGRKVRTITLRQQAIDILMQIPRSNWSPYVFWNKTEEGFYRAAANLFWDYAQEVDFGARMHDLRHKFAIDRLKEGWSVYRVQRYIGHGSVKTTERYYFRYLSQEQQEIANADGNVGL